MVNVGRIITTRERRRRRSGTKRPTNDRHRYAGGKKKKDRVEGGSRKTTLKGRLVRPPRKELTGLSPKGTTPREREIERVRLLFCPNGVAFLAPSEGIPERSSQASKARHTRGSIIIGENVRCGRLLKRAGGIFAAIARYTQKPSELKESLTHRKCALQMWTHAEKQGGKRSSFVNTLFPPVAVEPFRNLESNFPLDPSVHRLPQ